MSERSVNVEVAHKLHEKKDKRRAVAEEKERGADINPRVGMGIRRRIMRRLQRIGSMETTWLHSAARNACTTSRHLIPGFRLRRPAAKKWRNFSNDAFLKIMSCPLRPGLPPIRLTIPELRQGRHSCLSILITWKRRELNYAGRRTRRSSLLSQPARLGKTTSG
jgi:hypothetical protein